jgi:cathepsin A (carboxypeptidase C)
MPAAAPSPVLLTQACVPGPCRISNATLGPVWHRESWTTKANIIFIEQPVNVGYSYAEYGVHVVRFQTMTSTACAMMTFKDTTESAAQDISAFMAIFFENFTPFKGRRFHTAGESYGVRKECSASLKLVYHI